MVDFRLENSVRPFDLAGRTMARQSRQANWDKPYKSGVFSPTQKKGPVCTGPILSLCQWPTN
ncbi:MAG: hypothetical protein Rhims3KO_19370 [Hyphomicrobiales bacterium]